MSKFTRMAIAFATAATVSLAPLSIAQASSFGGSSADKQIIDDSDQRPGGQDSDQKRAEDLRAALVKVYKEEGHTENVVAQERAVKLAERALEGDLVYEKENDYLYVYQQPLQWAEQGFFAEIVLRFPEVLAPYMLENVHDLDISGTYVAPFGLTVVHDKDYFYIVNVFKLS